MAFRRLLLGVFAVYLLGLLGYIAPSHDHGPVEAQSHSHQDCQLCHVSEQTLIVSGPDILPETPAGPARLVESVWAPLLALRHRPFASRAPPSA